MMTPPKNNGLGALARLHRLDIEKLIVLSGRYLRSYAFQSERTGKLTTDLLQVRVKLRQVRAHLAELGDVPTNVEKRISTRRKLRRLDKVEACLDGDQRETERMREVYEKALAATLRILDMRRIQISLTTEGVR